MWNFRGFEPRHATMALSVAAHSCRKLAGDIVGIQPVRLFVCAFSTTGEPNIHPLSSLPFPSLPFLSFLFPFLPFPSLPFLSLCFLPRPDLPKMKIETVESTTRPQRIAPHSHVKGLGIDEEGKVCCPSNFCCRPLCAYVCAKERVCVYACASVRLCVCICACVHLCVCVSMRVNE